MIITSSGFTFWQAVTASTQKSIGTASPTSQRKPSQPRLIQWSIESMRYLRTSFDSKLTYGKCHFVVRTVPSGFFWKASGNMSFITLFGPQWRYTRSMYTFMPSACALSLNALKSASCPYSGSILS